MKKSVMVLFVSSLVSVAALSQNGAPHQAQNEPPFKADPKKNHAEGSQMGAIKMAKVFFIEPRDGATVGTKFKVKMGVEGVKLRPAGEAVDEITSGHHHLIIDDRVPAKGQPIVTDAKHIHFGKAETETELTLTPGDHTLTLQFADGAHRSFGEKMSQTIKIHVK